MLQPKKNPLIDEPLIAASAGTFRRVKTTYWILLGIITIIVLTWVWLLKSFGEEVYTEEWWRVSISRIVDWQFQKNVGLEQSSQLSENVKNLASQKAEMQERIQTLEKLDNKSEPEDIQTKIYEIGMELKFSNLKDWFSAFYQVILGQDQGPRLGSFIKFYGIKQTIELLKEKVK